MANQMTTPTHTDKERLMKPSNVLSILAITLTLFLAACGGGGGGDQPPDHSCPAGQHWDNSQNKCVADAPPADTTPPTISIVVDASVSGNSVPVTVNASDASGIANVALLVDGTTYSNSPTGSGPYAFSWDSTRVANGSHTLKAVAHDASLNANEASVSVTVTVSNSTTDTTPPDVAITAPSAGATLTGTTLITVSASDSGSGVAWVQFSVDGVTVSGQLSTSPYQFNWDSSTFANGSHNITAVARDNAGNSKTSTAVTVTTSNASVTIPDPSGLKVVKGDGEYSQNMTVTWNNNTTVVYSTIVEMSTTSDSAGFSQVFDRLNGAVKGRAWIVTPGANTYWFRVKNCTGVLCSGYSNVASIVMGPDLYAPTGVVAVEVASAVSASRRAVKITWTNNATTSNRYELKCLAGPSNNITMPVIVLNGTGLTQATVDDLNPGDRFNCSVIPVRYDASIPARYEGPSGTFFPVTLTP